MSEAITDNIPFPRKLRLARGVAKAIELAAYLSEWDTEAEVRSESDPGDPVVEDMIDEHDEIVAMARASVSDVHKADLPHIVDMMPQPIKEALALVNCLAMWRTSTEMVVECNLPPPGIADLTPGIDVAILSARQVCLQFDTVALAEEAIRAAQYGPRPKGIQ